MPAAKSSKPRKTSNRKNAKKTADATPAPEPTPEPVVVAAPEPVVAAPEPVVAAAETTAPTLDDQFKDILDRIVSFRTLATNLMADVKRLQKNVNKQVRESNKRNRKRKGATAPDGTVIKRPPSGFAKPAKISDALCQFLGQPAGTEMARTEVTREINAYIRANKLQDPENGRKINPDNKLKSLLSLTASDELTYFNLQRYMSPHFAKASKANKSA